MGQGQGQGHLMGKELDGIQTEGYEFSNEQTEQDVLCAISIPILQIND